MENVLNNPAIVPAQIKVKGEITARCYDQTTLSFFDHLWNKMVKFLGLDVMTWYKFGALKWADKKTNVVCNVGFQAVGEILTGTYASTGEINYAALGTGLTAVSAGDTQLTTETYRNAMFSGTVSSNVAYLTAVYTETETSGTFEEFGNFIDGTGTANSGSIWTHVLTGGWVKTLTDVLVVDQKYTFSSI